MSAKKRILRVIAKKYNQDPDDILVALWYLDEDRFGYLRNEHSVVRKKDERFVEGVIISKINEKSIERSPKKDKLKKRVNRNYDFSLVGRSIFWIVRFSIRRQLILAGLNIQL